jgi:hypothetical protein
MPELVRGYTHAAAPAVGAQPAATIAKAQRPVAIEEDVVAGCLPAYLQVGAQGSHGLRAEIDDAILEPFGLINAHTPGFEVEVSQSQAAHLAGDRRLRNNKGPGLHCFDIRAAWKHNNTSEEVKR